MDLASLTIEKARRALDEKEFTSLELTEAYLDSIQKNDGDIHAYLEVWKDTAREEAKKADEMIAEGKQLPLTGIPFAIKDNILIEGRIASAASRILETYTASYDATVIVKLKQQGVVFLGRTNMDEFAMGGSTENSAFGPTRNPHDISRVPGGSSGGSIAAVAANMALASLGSDTGGSVRQPAALCGIVGMKPTYGTVSRHGLIAMGSSLDQISPATKTVDDARIVLDVIRGKDSYDSTTLPNTLRKETSPLKKVIGVPRAFLKKGIDVDVLARFEERLDMLRERGYEIRDVDLPSFEYALAVYYIIMPAEASTNLARFDGIRYGLSVAADNIADVYAKTRAQGFGSEVRRRILLGAFVLSLGYVDAYYRKARSVRALIRQDLKKVFAECDAVVLPTTPTPAFKLGEKSDPLAMYAADICTVPVNIAGVPAISVPMGTLEREGAQLPVGFQIITDHETEDVMFKIATDVEEA